MNRIIKFRAFNKETKEMEYLELEEYDYDFGWKICHDGHSEPKEYEFMQFTGLKDKNGKEIYEGDIVKIYPKFTNQVVASMRWLPAWADDNIPIDHPFRKNESVVIGNIYENPELLPKVEDPNKSQDTEGK